ncbi:MAG TPA: hypothetical protein VNI36_04715 [Candidatus Dormibacteraeota bacterium]|nr:hypothetical protein [Candidatus Dormibacteraeota bacterium]
MQQSLLSTEAYQIDVSQITDLGDFEDFGLGINGRENWKFNGFTEQQEVPMDRIAPPPQPAAGGSFGNYIDNYPK